MDNQISEIFSKNKILLRNLKTLDFSEFSKKRNYQLFLGIDRDSFYTLVFLRASKSKVFNKEIGDLAAICKEIENKFDTLIRRRVLIYNSQICQKVISVNKDWKFYAFM